MHSDLKPEITLNRTALDGKFLAASEKCLKLGYKKGTSPFDRCLKQLSDN